MQQPLRDRKSWIFTPQRLQQRLRPLRPLRKPTIPMLMLMELATSTTVVTTTRPKKVAPLP